MLLRNNWVGPNMDAELNQETCDRYNNAELTVFIRVHLRQRDPSGGAASGIATDAGGTSRRILRWTDHTWRVWTRRYQQTAQAFWNGKFWLITPDNYVDIDFTDRGISYRPNIYRRFSLMVTPTDTNAHLTIDVVRLDPTESFFGSHSRLYDSRDLEPTNKGARMRQRAHVHEVGHLLGLGHSAQHRHECLSTGDTNSPICYGTTAAETDDVMGGGMDLSAWQSDPWRKATANITDTIEHVWAPMMRRHYPRSPDDVRLRRYQTVRPARG